MLNKPKKTSFTAQKDEGIELLQNDEYSYSLNISRRKMADFMHICKRRGTTAKEELGKFVDRQIAMHADKSN